MDPVASRPLAPRRFARRHPVTTFMVLAFAITWSVWVPRALVSQGHLDSGWPTTLGEFWTYGPAVAAVLAAWLASGRPGLRELGSRLRRWRVGGRWYGVFLFGPAAFWVLVVATNAALGWSEHLGRPLIVLALTWLLAGFVVASWVGRPGGDIDSATIRSADAVDHGAGRSGGYR